MPAHSSGQREAYVRIIVALGIGQIISWGMLIYGIAVLGAPIASELGLSRSTVFGAFSAALLVAGCAIPYSGAVVDRIGGRRVLIAGAAISAAGMGLLAMASSPALLIVGWLTLGIAMATSLYETAFATLSQQVQALRRAITAVTLFGGFASTVFLPLTLYATELVGWRFTVLGFAVLQLVVNIPLYVFAIPRTRSGDAGIRDEIARSERQPAAFKPAFAQLAALATAFAGAAFVTSSVSSHIVNLLSAKGLAAQAAVWVAALIGPAQVFGRVVELSSERRVGIIAAAITAFVVILATMMLLPLLGSSTLLACVFVVGYGIGNGIITIARGAVPAQLFGRTAYGANLGRISALSLVARALAPFLLGLTLDADPTLGATQLTLLVAAAIGLATFLIAIRAGKRE